MVIVKAMEKLPRLDQWPKHRTRLFSLGEEFLEVIFYAILFLLFTFLINETI